MTTSVTTIREQLRDLASPETAVLLQRFFKTGPGQYGEGDVFLGIKVPPMRALAKQYLDADLGTIESLLRSKYHEERFFALVLLMQRYKHGSEKDRIASYVLYLSNTRHINNWDLVDVSAPRIVGRHLQDKPRTELYRLARSPLLWERRISIIATSWFISLNEFGDTLNIAEILLHDKHDLMHKAVGWMLREVGKRDLAIEQDFLKKHYHDMPRTMLRYAIERFPEQLRKEYLHGLVGL